MQVPARIEELLEQHHRTADRTSLPPVFDGIAEDSADAERALLAAEVRLDPVAVAAAASLGSSATAPGEVGELVASVRRLLEVRWSALASESAENLRGMLMAMAADPRVVLILLADRVVAMRRLKRAPDERVLPLARECEEVFAPLANRLGVWQLKWELEDLAMYRLQPQIYQNLKTLLAETRSTRAAFVDEVKEALEVGLREAGVEDFSLSGRPKHIHSIYAKMRRKNVGFDEIYDATALRIIVESVPACYAALGVVHGLWTPVPGEFDDYVARPKDNGYQSLHTAVVGPRGRAVEVQIRTRRMHELGEFGVAAHWAYKEGGRARTDRETAKKFSALRQLLQWQENLEDAESLAESLRTDFFEDRVYVLTPDGEVIALPRGATPVDFAYRIHTLVGHRCRGALVNGDMVPLHHELQNGDRVEILTKKEPSPSRDWLNPNAGYIQSSSARQKIRQWFRQQDRSQAIADGRASLERECGRLGVVPSDLDALATQHNLRTGEDLLAAIGFGDLGAHGVAVNVYERRPRPAPAAPLAPTAVPRPGRRGAGLRAGGIDDVMGEPARCCKPVPGDDVVGFISRGRGIVIHRRDCTNILHTQEPERLLDVQWSIAQGHAYPATMELSVVDEPGVFRDVADVIAQAGVNILQSVAHRDRSGDTATLTITVEIRETGRLQILLTRLERLPAVLSAHRSADR